MHGRRQLVPEKFDVPASLETDRYRLRMLTVNDLIKDYDAVMSSVDHLQATFALGDPDGWPGSLTLEEDLIDLGWHQREFTLRTSFAYTMMTLDESRCLGCVYLNPSQTPDHDVQITMWVRASELASDLDMQLFTDVRQWIDDHWPFQSPAYPRR